MFRNVGRETFFKLQDDRIKYMPHCARYYPNTGLVTKQDYPDGIKFTNTKKNTTENMIRVSNCISSLDEKYMKDGLKKNRELLRKIENISHLESNLGIDVYMPSQQKKVLHIINKYYSKE
jgi:hypothetical protein